VFVSPLIVLTLSLLWLPFQATYAWTSSYSSLPAIPFGIATWRTSRWCDFNYSSSWNQVTSTLQTIPDFQRCFVGIERLVMFVVLSWCFAFEWVTYQINCIPPSKTETNLLDFETALFRGSIWFSTRSRTRSLRLTMMFLGEVGMSQSWFSQRESSWTAILVFPILRKTPKFSSIWLGTETMMIHIFTEVFVFPNLGGGFVS